MSSETSSSESWISWYASRPGNEFFLAIEEEFVRDNFNLYGLRPLFSFYDHALEMILDPDCPEEEDLQDRDYSEVYKEAILLYGIVHARFATSPRGLSLLKEKFLAGEFGTCPRSLCRGQKCLPIGLYDKPGRLPVKVYCPKCEQVYAPTLFGKRAVKTTDGAFFGSSLPHIFLQTFPDLVPMEIPLPYVPKIFGFKVHNHKSLIATKLQNEQSGIRQPRDLDPAIDLTDFNSDDSS